MTKATNQSVFGLDEQIYTYDAQNRMIASVKNGITTSYIYDGTGARVSKTTDGETTRYYLSDMNVINETVNGAFSARNIIAGEIIGRQEIGQNPYYFLKNGHGDVVRALRGTSTVAEYDYDAFGNPTLEEGTINNPIRYAGEYFDAETGNIYLRARYYDPSVGRFISEDTYWNPSNMIYGDSGNGGVPSIVAIMQSSNLYAYCINNPIKYTDPTGHVLPGDKEEFGENSDTYKILVDLGNRWNAAKTQAEENALHNLANEVRRLAREGTPIQYAQDKVMNQLHENAKIATNYQKSLIEGWQGILYSLSGGNYYEDSVTFLIGMAYGEWNYKYNPNWQVPYDVFDGKNMNVDNNRNWIAWMYFDGMLMAGDDFGNLNMAYVGYKMGLGTYVYQNFLTTDGKDAFWVQYGIDLAKSGR